MGCILSPHGDARSKEIELQIKREKKEQGKETKLLLLGAGESGKSTIAKQMRIIHCKGFNDEERLRYREVIFSNIILSMKALVGGIQKSGKFNELPTNIQQDAETLVEATSTSDQELTPELVVVIKSLWSQDIIKQTLLQNNELQISDSASFFFNDIDRISQPDYIPSEQDVLRARARTTGISEMTFMIYEHKFRMVDVGGQRSERKKWIHCFQSVTAVIFCAAMSEYDFCLFEDDSVNRMHEALNLFEEVCNCQWFADSAIILFLNKSDLFQEKMKRTDLKVCFPDYTGGLDYKAGIAFIKEKFLSLNRDPSKNLYSHVTCATDTQNIKFVFSAVQDLVIQSTLNKFGF